MAIIRVVTIALVLNILQFQASWCETAYDRQGDVITPGAELREGVLDRIISEKERIESIIIDDLTYHVDKNTVVRSANGGLSNLANYKPGTHVEFYALEGLLTKVMPSLLSKKTANSQDAVNTPVPPGKKSTQISNEGGVWKN